MLNKCLHLPQLNFHSPFIITHRPWWTFMTLSQAIMSTEPDSWSYDASAAASVIANAFHTSTVQWMNGWMKVSVSAGEQYCIECMKLWMKFFDKILNILTWHLQEKSFKLMWNCGCDHTCLSISLCNKYVISFTRHQRLFEITAIPIDVDLNILSQPAPLSRFQFHPKGNHLICL